MTTRLTRREILLRGLHLPVGGAVLLGLQACNGGNDGSGSSRTASTAAGGECVADTKVSEADQSSRASMGYVHESTNPSQKCAGCAFFHEAEGGGGCGTCDVLSKGPVNPNGHCNAWSARS
jgi:hypothetical protein